MKAIQGHLQALPTRIGKKWKEVFGCRSKSYNEVDTADTATTVADAPVPTVVDANHKPEGSSSKRGIPCQESFQAERSEAIPPREPGGKLKINQNRITH